MFDSPRRNHFSVIFERLAAVLTVFAVFAVNQLKSYGWEIFTVSFYRDLFHPASDGGERTALLLFLAFFAFIVFCLILSCYYWRRTTFYMEGTDFIFSRDTMFKTESRLPVQNISMVNVERTIVERLIGTARVKIDLHSSRTASRTDFKLVLKLAEAHALKDALMTLKANHAETARSSSREEFGEKFGEEAAADSGASVTQSATDKPERSPTVSFSAAQALLHKLLTFPVFQTFISMLMLFILPMLEADENTDMSRLWFVMFISLAGVAGSIIMGAVNLSGYHVTQSGSMIYIDCGALNKRNYMFEREKITALLIRQPLQARLLRLASVDIAVVGLGNEKNETTHLSLMTDKKNISRIMELCAPDFICGGETLKGRWPTLFTSLLRAILVGLLMLVTAALYESYLIITASVFVLLLIGGILEYRGKTLAADGRLVRYTKGIFGRYEYTVKIGDIQDVRIYTNFLLKRAGLARMKFTIMSAAQFKTHKTGWFKMDVLERIADVVLNN
ncbi:MAG: PH domain-containing protein [Oscillospiraceae bacterium]|nr:PH domain-containing protein [Oscillospiraceae bacterium]